MDTTPRADGDGTLWVLGQLWLASCLPVEATPHFSGEPSFFSTGIRLNVATTVLFDDDDESPRWLLTTTEGRLRGQRLILARSHPLHDVREKKKEYIRLAVDIMRQFWEHTNQEELSGVCDPICVAWYADGRHELLQTRFVFKLSLSTSWRKQLVALQGYVVSRRAEDGVYRASEDDLFGSCGSIRDGAAKVGLNMLTRAVAKCAMGVHGKEASATVSRSLDTSPPVSLRGLPKEMRIDLMRARYVLDSKGTLWFSRATEVRLRFPAEDKEPTVKNSHVEHQVLAACELAALELRKILREATHRGVPMGDCFAHFDPCKLGFADSDSLKRGLTKLGVGVSSEVADAMRLELGGADTTCFSAYDLAAFARHGTVDRIGHVRSSARHKRSRDQEKLAGARSVPSFDLDDDDVWNPVGRIRKRGPVAEATQGGEKNASCQDDQPQDWQGTPKSTALIPCFQYSKYPAPSQGNTLEEATSREVFNRKGPNTKVLSPKFRWDDLPHWARQRSRNALRELMGQHRRSLNKVQPRTTVHSPSLANPRKLHIRANETLYGDASDANHCTYSRPRSAQGQGDECRQHLAPNLDSPSRRETHGDNARKLAEADAKIHVGRGNVMSYRWVSRAASEPNHGGTALEAIEALSASQLAMGLELAQRDAFLVIVMPGLFMTVNYMERWLGGILKKRPDGKLLLIGSLGLPGTQWAEGEVLDAKTQAQGVSTLLLELMERGELRVDPSLCVVFMGLGSGANAVLHFAATFLKNAKFAPLREATRFLALTNPFSTNLTNSLESHQAQRPLKTLRRNIETGAHHEQLHSLVTALFSPEYIRKHGRATVLEEFWLQRQGLELPEPERPKSAPTSSRVKKRGAATSPIEKYRTKLPSGNVGVLKCIDGVLRGAALGELQGNINVPVLFITSTRDTLDSPKAVEAEEVTSLFELVSCNTQRRILVCPIEAGREILQEAPANTLEILLRAIHAAQTQPCIAPFSGTRYPGDAVEVQQGVMDIISGCSDQRRELPCNLPVEPNTTKSEVLCVEVSPKQSKYIAGAPDERDSVANELADAIEALAATPERPPVGVTKKSRREREFDLRKERASERKAKSERVKRRQELDRLKRIQQQEAENWAQQRECVYMQQEDDRSAAVVRHARNFELWTSSVIEAKERALELMAARDRREQKMAEDKLAHDRAYQHIQRVESFRQRKLDLLPQADVDSEPFHLGGGGCVEIEVVRDSCQRLLGQLALLRRQVVKTMQMELVRRDQVATFESQYLKHETGLRETERLQRIYARGGTTADVLGSVTSQESRDIDESVAKQQVQLGIYQSVLKERREMWSLAVSHVQKIKIVIRNKEAELRVVLCELRQRVAALRKKSGRIRAKNESLVTLKTIVESEIQAMSQRANLLAHEQSLLRTHKGRFFDTNIWQPGVMQRMSTARFSQDLQASLVNMNCGIEERVLQMKRIDGTLEGGVQKGQDVELKAQELDQIVRITEERLNHMVSKTLVQELQDVLDAKQELEPPDEPVQGKWRTESLAQTIRNKSSHQRTSEEKKWVALDILVNKALYMALSVPEKEELQLDDQYKTELRVEDVARLLNLPHEIQLALPHMESPGEIDAHKLLTTFTLEHGEADFVKADEQSQDHIFVTPSICAHSTPHSLQQNQALTPAIQNYMIHAGRSTTTNGERTDGHREHAPIVQKLDPIMNRAEEVLPVRIMGVDSEPSTGQTRACDLEGNPSVPPDASQHNYHCTGPLQKVDAAQSRTTPAATDACGPSKSTFTEISTAPQDTIKRIRLFDTMSDVAMRKTSENVGEMAVRVGELEVYSSTSCLLGIHESHVHSFSIVDLAPTFSVDLKVTITFKGCMDTKGFRKGRIGAVLRRKREHAGSLGSSPWECTGFAPHARQRLNIGDQFHQTPGTIVIQHCPKHVPLVCGMFEVHVTALGPTEYSVAVVAGQCELCASLVNKRLVEARNLQVRLKDLGSEMSDTWEGVRLRERQYQVCNALIEEAGLECRRCEEAIDELCEYLRPRDAGPKMGLLPDTSTKKGGHSSTNSSSESGTRSPSSTSRSGSTPLSRSSTTVSSSDLSETEREESWNEVAAIETELMHWGRLYTTRCQEKASVKQALDRLMQIRRDRRAEQTRVEEQLQEISAELPTVVAALEGPNAAAEMLRYLGVSPGSSGSGPPSSIGGEFAHNTVSLETPAEKTRRAFERGGWGALTLEEQQWVTVDQSMCPDKYLWLKQQQQEEARRKIGRGKKGRTKPHKNPAIDQCRYQRSELMRILAEPFEDLNRREIHVRQLMHKFHDDPRLMRIAGPVQHSSTHDVSLAERARCKDHRHRTTTEKEWISLDKVLNPQVWKRAKGGVPGTQNDQRPPEAGHPHVPREEQHQEWTCPFSRDDLLRIWSYSADPDACVATEDEKRAYKLLITYNGPYQGVASRDGDHALKGGQAGKTTEKSQTDIDLRLRCLQQELDRVACNSNPGMNSRVLHAVLQHYPTSTLRLALETEMDRLLREQVQQRERKNAYLIEDFSSSEEEDEDYTLGRKTQNRRTRRLKRRASGGDMNIFAARKRMLLDSRMTQLEKDNVKRIARLGPGGCPACMSNPCKHTPVVNVEDTTSRLKRISDELHFARTSTEDFIESTFYIWANEGETTSFRRVEFIEELSSQQNHLRHMLKLHFIDQEFHEVNRTSRQHFECVALHGYRTFLWTKDAQVAFEREHSRLVARLVASGIVNDILEWMLEGWHFGERQSRHEVVGYVPSTQKAGLGNTEVASKEREKPTAEEEKTLQEQEEDKASMFTLPRGVDGSSWNPSSERVVKKGGVHDEEISFMEKTMHFGLFCISIMYFRARWLLRQQRQNAAQVKLGWSIDTSVPVRAQRKIVGQTSVTSTQAGYQRVKVRKDKEQAEVLADFAGFLAVEKRELDAAQLLQRVYRGHIGRKAACRWRAKRAEYNATNSLMVSAAVTIQRLMRGSWGRNRAKTVRAGIASWLAHLVEDESREFEAEVLSTNKLEALKRGIGELVVDDGSDDSDS